MSRFLKWTILVAGSLAAALLLAVVLLPSMIEVERYRPLIETEASRALGRPVRLEGTLDLSVFPWLGVRAGGLRVENPEGFSEPLLLSVDEAEIRVAALPLLRRAVEVSRFVLRAPRIVLERTAEGRANWEGIGPEPPAGDGGTAGKTTPSAPGTAAEPTTESGGPAIPDLAVEELAIAGGRLLWIDAAAGERREVSGLNLRVEHLSLDRPVALDVSARLDGRPVRLAGEIGPVGPSPGTGTLPLSLTVSALDEFEAEISGSVTDPATDPAADLSLRISPFSPRKIVEILGLPFAPNTADPDALESVGLSVRFAGGPEAFSLSDGELTLDQSRATFSGELRSLSPLDLAAAATVDALDATRYLPPPAADGAATKSVSSKAGKAGKADGGGFDLSLLERATLDIAVETGRLVLPGKVSLSDAALKFSGKSGRFDLNLSARRDGLPLALSGTIGPVAPDRVGLDLTLNGLDILGAKVTGAVVRPATDPALDAAISVDPFDPRKLAEALGVPFPANTADPSALRRVGFAGKVRAGAGSARVRDGVFILDDTTIRGFLDAKRFDPPDAGFDLALDRIDLDRYLPPNAEGAASPASAEPRDGSPAASPDTDPLRRVRMDGAFRADSLRVRRLELTNIHLKIFGEQGIFRLDPLRVNLYRGAMSLTGQADFTGPEPDVRVDATVRDVATGPLLADAADSEAVSGDLNASAKLSARGDRAESIARTLGGTADLHFSDGRIAGMNLVDMARNLEAAFRKARGQTPTEASGTAFSELSAALSIADGRATVTEARLVSPVMEATAGGTVNLADRTLDLRMTPTFVQPVGGRAAVAVPVAIGGTFGRPTYRPDLENLIRIDPRKAAEAIAKDPEQGIRDILDEQKDRIRSILLPGRDAPAAKSDGGDGSTSSSDAGKPSGSGASDGEEEPRENAPPEKRKPSAEDAVRDLLRTLPFGK